MLRGLGLGLMFLLVIESLLVVEFVPSFGFRAEASLGVLGGGRLPPLRPGLEFGFWLGLWLWLEIWLWIWIGPRSSGALPGRPLGSDLRPRGVLGGEDVVGVGHGATSARKSA